MALACTKSEYISQGNCFTQPNFNQHEQLAILVYRMAQYLDAQMGADTYAVAPFTQLLTDSNNATCGLSDDQIVAANIGIWNVAVPATFTPNQFANAGIVAALTNATAATSIACLKDYSNAQLVKMQLFLQCNIFALLGL